MTDYKQYVAKSSPVCDSDLYGLAKQKNIPVDGIQNIQKQLAQNDTGTSGINDSASPGREEGSIYHRDFCADRAHDISAVANTVSGTVIQDADSDVDVTDILARINSANEEATALQEQRRLEKEAEAEREREELVAKRKAELLKGRVESEEAYRAAEAERERKIEEELRMEQERKAALRERVVSVFGGRGRTEKQKAVLPPEEADTPVKEETGETMKNAAPAMPEQETGQPEAPPTPQLSETGNTEEPEACLETMTEKDETLEKPGKKSIRFHKKKEPEKRKSELCNPKVKEKGQQEKAYGTAAPEEDDLYALAYTDTLTGLENAHAFERAPFAKTLTLIHLTGFGDLSRASGDKFAEITGQCMKTVKKENERCYYLGNGEFCVLSEHTPDVFLATVRARLHSLSIDIESQIMIGAEDNRTQLSLAREVLETPKEKPKSYNERLTSAQRQMKESVAENHEPVIEEDVANMMDIVQQHDDEIIMIFMVSPDFNNLFIFLDVDDFLQVAWDVGADMDYSYIYAVYPGGALYYGADDYSSDITGLFQRIAESISGRDVRMKEISHIDGINIFENIYIK